MTNGKKHARLIIVNPGGKKENAYKEPENDDNYAKTLYEIVQFLGLEEKDVDKGYYHIITKNRFSEAKHEMEKIYTKIKEEGKNEDQVKLIAVVLKDGFYSEDGDAIYFEEGPRLIEEFFRPIYQDADRTVNLCRIILCVMSFHSRNYFQPDEKSKFIKSVEDEENARIHTFLKAWDKHDLDQQSLVSGKLNTMKIFYCRREEKFTFDKQRIKIFAEFVNQLSKSKDERIIFQRFFEVSLTHSLVDDVFNLYSSRHPEMFMLHGKPLFASMVVQVDDDQDEGPSVTTYTRDEDVFSAAINHFFEEPKIMTIREENILTPCKNYPELNAVTKEDAKNYFKRIKMKMLQEKPPAVIIYISSHGYFHKGGKYVILSKIEGREDEGEFVCLETLLEILDEDLNDERNTSILRSIPKIVINDCCYVKEDRINPRVTNTPIPQRQGAEGARRNRPKNNQSAPKDKKLKQKMNTIIFQPSTEQDFAYSCSMLDAIISCFNHNLQSSTVDIMDLAFRVVRYFSQLPNNHEAIIVPEENRLKYQDVHPNKDKYDRIVSWYKEVKVPPMCEIDIDLRGNFSLSLKKADTPFNIAAFNKWHYFRTRQNQRSSRIKEIQ